MNQQILFILHPSFCSLSSTLFRLCKMPKPVQRDCRIVDINTNDKLKVDIADINTQDALKVKMDQYGHSSNALQVKVVEWSENDAIKVKSVQ